MSVLSFNNTSSIIPQMSKSSASFYKTEELSTLSKMNLVIYVQILRGRWRDYTDKTRDILYVKMSLDATSPSYRNS